MVDFCDSHFKTDCLPVWSTLAEQESEITHLRHRFIDTAEALERDGISDPAGREHLATLLGHLYDLKLVCAAYSVELPTMILGI